MRIVVKNLPAKITEDNINEFFGKYGCITDIYFLRNNDGSSKGICFIGYLKEEMAEKAVLIRNNTYIENRKIIVEKNTGEKFTRRAEENFNTNFIKIINLSEKITEENLRSYFDKYGKIRNVSIEVAGEKKQAIVEFREKEIVEKVVKENRPIFGCRTIIYPFVKNERKNYFNSLFFDFKCITQKIHAHENIPIDKLVDIESKDLATRVSLLETHLIQETKAFLQSNGIFLDNILSGKNKRALIVRNFDLIENLESYRCTVRIAPSKTLALLFFDKEPDCKFLFKKFNKMRRENRQIFCEYVPITSDRPVLMEFTDKLIIKNIPFQASQNEIRQLIESQVKIKNIRLPMKNEEQHRGFCFLTFMSAKDARTIYEYFGKNTHLYGRRLIIEVAA